MRNFLFGLSLTLVAIQAGFASCLDTTVLIQNGSPGWDNTTKIYTPAAAGAINSVFTGCTDATITVHLRYPAGDTIKIANEITVTGRSGKTTSIVGEGVNDSILTLVEANSADPELVKVLTGNATILSNLGFARKAVNVTSSSVTISADGSIVKGCHFWMADNTSSGTGPLLDITANSVLVEKCLFRAPPDGTGRSVAVHTGGTANGVELRSNVFFSTGLYLTSSGTIHVIANTFAGSRNDWNAIIVGSAISAPTTAEKNVTILHNLFAFKQDGLPPIAFSGSVASSDVILRNAWSRVGNSSLALAVSASTGSAPITLNNTAGTGANTPLPKGFSNYGPASYDVKDYPLTQLRTEGTLVRNNANFGKIFRVFVNSAWTGMADIKDLPAANLFFPNFLPFLPGKSWLPNVKVGAFVDQDQLETPAPLDSGARGSALKFTITPTDSTKIKVTRMSFDANYYKTAALTPAFMLFFFSDTLSKLTGSNDSTALIASTRGAYIHRTVDASDDGIYTVPRTVRNDRKDIFVKMLHYRGGLQAAVQSDAAIATVSNVPSYPINDLSLTVDPNSPFLTGTVNISVTHGAELIDSIRIVTATVGGQGVDSVSKPASTTKVDFSFPVKKGTFVFYAVPLAKLSGVTKPGQATPNSSAYTFLTLPSDTVFVSYKSGTCTGADGTENLPYCSLDSALKEIATKKGTTILIKNSNPMVPMEDIAIAPTASSDSTPLTITTKLVSGNYDVNRPIFRGKTKEAVTITRKYVTLKGFFIEMPVGSANTALNVKAGGAVIEGNVFRAAASGFVDGAAVNVEIGASAEMRFINNIVWAFSKNVQITNSSSPGIRVINNTFVEDAALNAGKGIGINVVGAGGTGAVFANNFFSGLTNPIDASVGGKTPSPTLDHNVFTHKPELRGLTETGLDTSSYRIKNTDIWSGAYSTNLEGEFTLAIDCSQISPCTPLYGGSSSATYNTNISTDFTGKARPSTNKKEVGAYEFNVNPSSVLGVLSIDPSTIDTNYQRINFVVTGKTFDPSEADSVYVFWSTTNLGNSISPNLSNIPKSRQKAFPIAALGAGNFSGFADSIKEENTPFWFYAALGRTPTGGNRSLGYAYSAQITSGFNVDSSDCKFEKSKSACPSDGGVFKPVNPQFPNFQTRVIMTEPVTTTGNIFKNPQFESIPNPNQFNLDLLSPLPMIIFSTKIDGLGAPGSQQMFRATITIDGILNLDGKDLFLIPTDPNGMPSLVTSWGYSLENGKTKINIESSLDGTQQYAFGKLQASMEPGVIISTDAAPPVYDFKAAKDSAIVHIPVKIKGTGFKTANPLVLISIVPAGGTVSGVLGGTYHSSTVALTTGYTNLYDSLKQARFYKYYLKAVSAEAASTVAGGHKKPFTLDSVGASEFTSATVKDAQDLLVAGGNLSEMTVFLPVSKGFKAPENYADKTAKGSRSIEVEYTVFDGAKISRSRSFIRTSFSESNLQFTEQHTYPASSNTRPKWNLFGYPWDEGSDPDLTRILGVTSWDKDHRRLMHYKGAGNGAGAFDVYTGSNMDAIKFDSAQASWSGSTDEYKPVCSTGMSLDYQAFSLNLTPGQWNDFSLPFNFPITWKDILDSSGLTEKSLSAFKYNNDGAAPEWVAVTAGSVASSVAGTVLLPWQGFSVKPTTAITLKFPILDSSRSGAKSAPKAAAKNDDSWNARLQAFNGTASMTLRIGKGNQEYLFGEAPDVPGQDFRIALKRNTPAGEENVSQFIQADDGSWQGHWALQASAAKGSTGLSLRVSDASREVPIYLVDALHKTAVPLSADAPIQVSEGDLRANDYHVVAGDSHYLKAVLDGLVPLHLLALSNYPNPFAGSTLIRYALPESFGKVAFDLKVRDFRGRTVWERTIQGGSSLNYLWDGRDKMNSPLPAGVYTLSLEAAATGKPVFRANRRILRM
ncbi:MAG: hypothetical protein JWO30_2341 [Fibrobacteres bacterium]|nr:hypothetical protein [Fibrobacterota bacterium]